ncbi:MAG: hypothetical protein Kow0025_20820 [Thermodesulfovibrionales bacterium]
MKTALALAAYLATAVFVGRLLSGLVVLWRTPGSVREALSPEKGGFLPLLRGLADVLFFGRLLRVNPLLWAGEAAFHVSFFLVVVWHLRFFVSPPPGWLTGLGPFSIFAGYVLAGSVVYIFVVRLLVEKAISRRNLFLLAVSLAQAAAGLLMRTAFRVNLMEAQDFASGLLALGPGEPPGSALFAVHFLLALVILAYLPTHVFTAPLVMLEARRREDGLRMVMHDK